MREQLPSSDAGKRLSPEIAKQVRELIITGEMRGHERVRTEHLAERLGVSATPVREALMSLAGEGMVAFDPGRGFSVVPLTRRDVLDVYDMQAYVAGELAARATERLSDEELVRLEKAQAALVEAIEVGDSEAIERHDFTFHQLINHSAGSPKLTWMLSLTLHYVPFSGHGDIPGWPLVARDSHVPILRALRGRTASTARDFMCAHIRQAGDLLVQALGERGVLVDH